MLYDKIELESDEDVLLESRRHWFVLLTQVLPFPVAAVLPYFFYLLTEHLFESSILIVDPMSPYVWYGYTLWLLLLWMGIFNVWTNHYLDMLVVTSKRVMIINQKGFWRRNIASFRLERLQDLVVEIDGFFATMLDFGVVHAETAGHGEEDLRVYGMPHPREIKAAVTKASDALLPDSGRTMAAAAAEPSAL